MSHLKTNSAQDRTHFFKIIDKDNITTIEFPVTKIRNYGPFAEAFIFDEFLDDISEEEILEVLNYFNYDLYPRFVGEFVPDPRPNRLNTNKVIILFDKFPSFGPRGYYSSHYSEKYGRDVIVIDIESAKTFKYNYILAHEFAHLIRYAYSKEEDDWIHEGIAEFVEYYFNPISIYFFKKMQNDPMKSDFLFFYYLYKHFGGINVIREIFKGTAGGPYNIGEALSKARHEERDPVKNNFYEFKATRLNYFLAVFLNAYQNYIESKNLFNLHLDDFSPYLTYWGVRTEKLAYDFSVPIFANSAIYFHLENHDCFFIKKRNLEKLHLYHFQTSKGPYLKKITSEKKYCTEDNDFFVLINLSPNLMTFEVTSAKEKWMQH